MKIKNGIAIAKNFSSVQTEKFDKTILKKRKCSNRWSTKLVREVSRGKAKEFLRYKVMKTDENDWF